VSRRWPDLHDPDEPEVRRLPPGVRHLVRWVKLCERQGTRLVDVLDDWRREAARANDIAERNAEALAQLADAATRLAQHADGYLGDPDDWQPPGDEVTDYGEP
jgi:phytoene dehydrogenase-like protein